MLKSSLKFAIPVCVALLFVGSVAHADTNFWLLGGGYLKEIFSNVGLQIQQLGSAGTPCVTVDATGKFGTSTCASGNQVFPFTPTSYGVSTSTIVGFTDSLLVADGMSTTTVAPGTVDGGAGTLGITAENGTVNLSLAGAGNTILSNSAGGIFLIPSSSTGLRIFDRSGTYAIFDTSALVSSDKTFTFPNASGTFCLTSGGIGCFINASSTIGDGTQTGGLTISGGATTTGNAYFAGNVGIGTTSPYALLSLSNSAATAANTPLFAIASTTGGNATSTLMTVLANGNVGIGTASPAYPLQVVGSGGTSNDQAIAVSNATANYWTMGRNNSTGSFDLWGNQYNGIPLTVLTSGNVGIGTTSPTNMLSVGAGGYADVSATGGYKFDGNKFIYASSTNFSTVMGIGAGTGLDATSTWTTDTAIGYKALNGTPASNATVGGNTAIGYLALTARTSGPNNTAIGSNAMKALTTGNGNVGIGNAALSGITGAVNNMAIGGQAMQNFTSGNGNVVFGATAMTGAAGASGSFNVAIGQNALQGLSSSNRNIGIGRDSGVSITSGSNNIFIGAETASTTAMQTGSANIALGYDILLPSTNGSNQLDIGNLIFGTGINGEGAALSTGSVGIGTTTPFAALSVSSTNNPLFSLATSTGNPVWGIDGNGHLITSGPKPTLSSCGAGTPTVTGNDQGGTIMVTNATTLCTLTFAKAYSSTGSLYCLVSANAAVAPYISATSTTAVTFGFNSSNPTLYYTCAEHSATGI